MGTWVMPASDIVQITPVPRNWRCYPGIYYKNIDEECIDRIIKNDKIDRIQISEKLPDEAFEAIDMILSRKPELAFRIYSIYEEFDISFLERMPHLKNLTLECHLRSCPDAIDFNVLTRLKLKTLSLQAFDLRDYSFMQSLSTELEDLTIAADTTGAAIQFDCKWLLRYEHLKSLWLSNKARKNISCLAEHPHIKSLSLRGIKLTDFGFLKQMQLEKLALLWNSNNQLAELGELTSLKEIELWRIGKLDNIDFISKLVNLEVIRLQDLKHIKELPDLSKLHNLKRLILDNTGIDFSKIDDDLMKIVECYNFE